MLQYMLAVVIVERNCMPKLRVLSYTIKDLRINLILQYISLHHVRYIDDFNHWGCSYAQQGKVKVLKEHVGNYYYRPQSM